MAYLKRRAYCENAKLQSKGASRVLQILNTFGTKEGNEQSVEFFFYTDCEKRRKTCQNSSLSWDMRSMVSTKLAVSIPFLAAHQLLK